jgi:uncharacterized membrane protein
MSATISHPSMVHAASTRPFRFGAAETGTGEAGVGEYSVQWLLKRNRSVTPRQMVIFYASLCLLSLGIGTFFWVQGATLVMPFAWIEVVAVGTAFLIYARHANDNENIRLQPGRLTVEHFFGSHVERAEFVPAWVRVEPEHGDQSLIELSGQGRRISVGRFVRPELRRQLADELRWALRRWQWMPAQDHGACADGEGADSQAATQHKSEN